jgi:hypothetical protein
MDIVLLLMNARDWPETEGPEVCLDPPHNAGGCGGGAMLLSWSGRQSWGGGDAAGGSGGPKNDLRNPNIPMVELPIDIAWGGGA